MTKKISSHPALFSKFTNEDIEKLGLELEQRRLFTNLTPVIPRTHLQNILEQIPNLNLSSEKAKSESIIAPIILDIFQKNPGKISFFPGTISAWMLRKASLGFAITFFLKTGRDSTEIADFLCRRSQK